MQIEQADIDCAFAEIVRHFTTTRPVAPAEPTKTAEPDLMDQVCQVINTRPYLEGEWIWHGLNAAGNGERTAQHLDHARQLIQRYGWTQGHYGNPERGYCIRGALLAVISSGSGANQYTYSAGTGCIELVLMAKGLRAFAPFWNDDPSRTAAEVIAVLRQAAEVARRFGP